MKTLLALVLSCVIMAVIFSRIDLGELRTYLAEMDFVLFVLGVLFFIPQALISAWRWQWMIRKWCVIGLWEACKLVLAAAAINILVPSRVGDISKAYFIAKDGRLDIKRGMNVVIFEKYIDMMALGIVILTGIAATREWNAPTVAGLAYSLGMLALLPVFHFIRLDLFAGHPSFERRKILSRFKHFLLDAHDYLEDVKGDMGGLAFITLLSVFLWFIHLLQFYVIFLALHSEVSCFQVFRLVPLAILVGLIPISMAGVGTRDSAMIYLFAPYEKVSLMVGVGLFSSLRYFVPGLLGLPFMNQYIVRREED